MYYVLKQAVWITRADRVNRLQFVPPENIALVRKHRDVLDQIFRFSSTAIRSTQSPIRSKNKGCHLKNCPIAVATNTSFGIRTKPKSDSTIRTASPGPNRDHKTRLDNRRHRRTEPASRRDNSRHTLHHSKSTRFGVSDLTACSPTTARC